MGKALRAIAVLGLGIALAAAATMQGCARFDPGRSTLRGPQAVGGLLDLRGWDFRTMGEVSLAGQWDFASNALLDAAGAAGRSQWERRDVPDFWTHPEGGDRPGTGAGTYRLRILLPTGAPKLAIRNSTGMNAFELEVNGETVVRVGRPSLARASAVSAYRPGVTPIETGGDSLSILLRVSDYEYRSGGIWRPLVLGESATLAAEQQTTVDLQIIITVIVAALALNSFIIYIFRNKETSYLFFALFGFVIALRPLVTGEYALMQLLPGLSFNILVRIEYATAMLGVPAAIAFFLSFFPTVGKRLWIMLVPFAPFVIFELVFPLYWLTWSIFVFYAIAIASILLLTGAVLVRAAYRKIQGGLAMCIGGSLIGLCAINDILYSSHIIRTGNWLPYILAFFVFLQSLVLAKRFTSAFDRAELLSLELKSSNEMLKDQIQNAMATSARLEESLSEKEILLKEVHHRVKNSLQIVASIVSLQAHRSSEPAVEDMSRSINERIRVISLANEKLYDMESGDKIDLVGYARDILKLAISSYQTEGLAIEARVEGGRVDVDSAVGIDFGLILTELLANALKHALVPKGGGRLLVSVHEEGGALRFEVSDDGPGFSEGFEPGNNETLGYKIVQALLRRREGTIRVTRGEGAVVSCSMVIV